MKNRLVLATTNPGKAKEIAWALRQHFDCALLSGFDQLPQEPEETGTTFRENSRQKADFWGNFFKKPTLAEDSGFILDVLPDRFGIRTRREFEARDDMDWMTQFLELIASLENRKATFFSAVSYFDPTTQKTIEFEHEVKGEILEFPQTPLEKGVPVSAVFRPENNPLVYSAMSRDEKNRCSHRGGVLQQFLDWHQAEHSTEA